jgi:hypothetical protein
MQVNNDDFRSLINSKNESIVPYFLNTSNSNNQSTSQIKFRYFSMSSTQQHHQKDNTSVIGKMKYFI